MSIWQVVFEFAVGLTLDAGVLLFPSIAEWLLHKKIRAMLLSE